jgi:hypothetical protein
MNSMSQGPRLDAESDREGAQICRSIDWYAEGESRTIEVDGFQVTVRFVGRKGRRGRIMITAPPGATFRSTDFA